MTRPAPLAAVLLVALASSAAAQEAWTPEILSDAVQDEHYLPDFSYAGYRWGEEPLPERFDGHAVLDAAAYGAVPDDGDDDTAALRAAFAAAHDTDGPVLVRLPAGRLVLTDILYIERSDFVLQGAGGGADGTTLYMPAPLGALPTPAPMAELEEYLLANDKRQRERDRGIDEPFSLYSWSGGYIWTNTPGGRGKPYLARYDREPATLATGLSGVRGTHVVTAEGGADVAPGQIVQVNWFNREGPDGSLLDYLYAGRAGDLAIGERHWESPDMPLTRQEVTVLAVDGDRVTIKEPLLHDLRPAWTPTLTAWEPITEVGIEGIRFEFLYDEYNVHHVEPGNNAVYLTNTAHSWVRDVDVVNGDSGILTDVCSNVTIEDVGVYGRTYHYGVHMGDCYNVLARDVYVAAPVVHTFTFNTGSRMCVYTHSTATDGPVLDQHSGLNYQNLFDDLVLYLDDPEHGPITGGGASYWKPSHAAYPVLWNVRFEFLYPEPLYSGGGAVAVEGLDDGPAARIVGMRANRPITLSYGPDAYVEGLNRPEIAVPSLYEYQLRRRLAHEAADRSTP
ncbi:glycosyl hydrolase family 28-related protein [Rubrivirga sp. S365]|uniref:glycosyl hydrolase family 28-related protein n=1 Tax=Rubrivirga sp. S365 TaxID=3076080 RepID=UPI0028C7A135|nr:glycosyl hydrolase family 28-related protein [Rubrivirga sp. S365]MDT7856559.1 glycosyl hydrolase family 28-related protein [Rubrivirga sp. S365]